MRAIQAWSLMMLVMVSAAFGQTASDLGEGLRAELTNTSGVTAIKWWGKAGRTYFVQSSETLLPNSWQFMPVVEAGASAVHTWNLQTSAERMFVRLVFTDQLYSGAAGDADFDGDGLSNALEVSTTGPHTDPFLADTDWDGDKDGAEVTAGSNPKSSSSNSGSGSTGSGPLNPDAHYRHGIRLNHSWKGMWADYSGALEQPGIADSHDTYAGVYTSAGAFAYGPLHDYSGNKTSDVLSTWDSTAFPAPSLPMFNLAGSHFWMDNLWSENTITTSSGKYINNEMERMTLQIQAVASPGAPSWARRSVAVIDYLNGLTPASIAKEGCVVFSASNAKATGAITEHVSAGPEAGTAVITSKLAAHEWHHLKVLDVDIEPAENMSGTIGDVVPSVQGEKSFVRHFVTPKTSEELPQEYVELTAGSISTATFDELFEWEGGLAGATSTTHRVSRATPAVTKVKIITKKTKVVVSEMHVWVVWCDPPTVTPATAEFVQDYVPHVVANIVIGQLHVGARWKCTTPWKFVYTIQPAEICDVGVAERPNLEGGAANPVPGYRNNNLHTTKPSNGVADSADNKWDVSRQMQIRILNPNSISKTAQESTGSNWYAAQPTANDIPVPFPSNPVEGNDDPRMADEDTNPYQARQGGELDHDAKQLSSHDLPDFVVGQSWGAAAFRYGVEANFREFCRLEIHDGARSTGTFWFKISDDHAWHHYLHAIYNDPPAEWQDDNPPSSSDEGHFNP